MIFLSKEQITHIHSKVIEQTGGLDGVRDETLLDSALKNPFQTFDNNELYPTIPDKIARLTYNLISNHPFVDGNKRIGTLVMLIGLEINQIEIDFTDDDVIKIGLKIAQGKMSDSDLASWIKSKI